ncbi:RNA-binding protein RO60-like [Mytilus trossulus]|uniref:RNA-binding protein RO60-like n=1 Tax=Mytilus trossulus TaxID=6551 RepID=UPI0030066AE3
MEGDEMDVDWVPTQERGDPFPLSKPLTDYQIKNVAGGYVFEVTDIDRLHRFLCLGTELGYYKANSQHRKFSRSEVQAIDRLIQAERGHEVVRCIKDVSVRGRACKQNPTLYALAVCARSNDPRTKHAAYSVLNEVCRIPTHLFQFIKYCEEMSGHETGWGRAHRIAISKWYKQFVEVGLHARKTPLKLAYLVTKYRRRFKWSHKDVIRLSHTRSKHKAIKIILQDVLGKQMEVTDSRESSDVKEFLLAVKEAKRCSIDNKKDEDKLCQYIALHELSWEHVPNKFLKHSVKVWDVLSRLMPMTAMIRNLGKMTSMGMHDDKPGATHWVDHVVSRLDDDDELKRNRIHPLTLLIAMKHYEKGAQRNNKISWDPNPRIIEALSKAFIRSTRIQQPDKMKYLMAVSVGENMQKPICGSTITAGEAAAAMVYSTIQTQDVEVILFTNRIEEAFTATITKADNLKSIEQKIYEIPKETKSKYIKQDLSVPFIWAASRKKKFDAIMVFTDSITSCGFIHPAEALKMYTEYVTIPDYRFVVVAMTSDKYSVAAPDSVHNLDVVGFDTSTPDIIMNFVLNLKQRPMEEDIRWHDDDDIL